MPKIMKKCPSISNRMRSQSHINTDAFETRSAQSFGATNWSNTDRLFGDARGFYKIVNKRREMFTCC